MWYRLVLIFPPPVAAMANTHWLLLHCAGERSSPVNSSKQKTSNIPSAIAPAEKKNPEVALHGKPSFRVTKRTNKSKNGINLCEPSVYQKHQKVACCITSIVIKWHVSHFKQISLRNKYQANKNVLNISTAMHAHIQYNSTLAHEILISLNSSLNNRWILSDPSFFSFFFFCTTIKNSPQKAQQLGKSKNFFFYMWEIWAGDVVHSGQASNLLHS